MVSVKLVVVLAIIGCVAIAEVQGDRSSSSSSSTESSEKNLSDQSEELVSHVIHIKHERPDRDDKPDRAPMPVGIGVSVFALVGPHYAVESSEEDESRQKLEEYPFVQVQGARGRGRGKRSSSSSSSSSSSESAEKRIGRRDGHDRPDRHGRIGRRDGHDRPDRHGRIGRRDGHDRPDRHGRIGRRDGHDRPDRHGRIGRPDGHDDPRKHGGLIGRPDGHDNPARWGPIGRPDGHDDPARHGGLIGRPDGHDDPARHGGLIGRPDGHDDPARHGGLIGRPDGHDDPARHGGLIGRPDGHDDPARHGGLIGRPDGHDDPARHGGLIGRPDGHDDPARHGGLIGRPDGHDDPASWGPIGRPDGHDDPAQHGGLIGRPDGHEQSQLPSVNLDAELLMNDGNNEESESRNKESLEIGTDNAESSQENEIGVGESDLSNKEEANKPYVWNEIGLTDAENDLLNEGNMSIQFMDTFARENSLDTNFWQRDISGFRGGNNEFQYYSGHPAVLYGKNGVLTISPQKTSDLVWAHEHNRMYDPLTDAYSEKDCNMEPCWQQNEGDGGLPILSARVKSATKINLNKPGILVIRAQMPRGDYLWPIIQLLPAEQKYGSWPTSGAITLAQTRGNMDYHETNGAQVGNSVVETVVFFGGAGCTKQVKKLKDIGTPLSDGYHVYKYTWDGKGNMDLFIDGQNYGKIDLPAAVKNEKNTDDCVKAAYEGQPDSAPFDNEFRLALMVAVGGRGAFRDYMKTNGKLQKDIWSHNDQTPMTNFWGQRDSWENTWKNEQGEAVSDLKIDVIRLYQGE